VEADESELEGVLTDIEELDKGWPYDPGEPYRTDREDLLRRFGNAWDRDRIEDLVSERLKLMKKREALEARIKLRRRLITELDSEIGFLNAVEF
jgi:hypothetical protein